MRNLPAAILLLAIPASAAAQSIDVPSLSSKARVEQRVGVTDFSIDYSSPGVKGRKIWGTVVPYDKVWRADVLLIARLLGSSAVQI